jgi:tRNA1Val (adenine37-N6)-methyltransferase
MKPFIFKQFTVNQDRCAMKVGTDAVLLGAWTPVDHHPISILDIGSGTGILSLMLAQRSNAVQGKRIKKIRSHKDLNSI